MKIISLVLMYCMFPWIEVSENILHHFGGHNLTLTEAEKILGEPCQQVEKVSTAEHGGHQFKTSFVSIINDKAVLYYMFDSYINEAAAINKFEEFYKSNKALPGFESLQNLGEQSFYHTDFENFGLLIARKENQIIRLKVNKISKAYSKKEMHQVSKGLLLRI